MSNFCFLIIVITYCISLTQGFKVAIVEYKPETRYNSSSEDLIKINLKNYLNLIDSIPKADVIIFPEATLDYGVPSEPETATIVLKDKEPCSSEDKEVAEFLRQLSCKAKEKQAYILANIKEKEKCSQDCPSSGYFIYNTNVVLDKTGKVLARYRKYNLFEEPGVTTPEEVDLTTFTYQNVTFGTFTCFDILFQEPSLDLVSKKEVKYILYPSMWFSELPFLTALQTQQMWSMATDTVLISSGASNPTVGSGGSGIYLGLNGTLTTTILINAVSKITIQDVYEDNPIPPVNEDTDALAKEMDSFYMLQDYLDNYTYQIINGSSVFLSHSNVFCKLTFETEERTEELNNYHYFAVAYSGTRKYGREVTAGIEVCAIVACPQQDIRSCGTRFKDYTTVSWSRSFNKIKIKMEISGTEKRMQFPNTLKASMRPIPANDLVWSRMVQEENNRTLVSLSTEVKQDRLMTFGIYGRYFGNDVKS